MSDFTMYRLGKPEGNTPATDAPKEDLFAKMKREAAEKGAASIAARDAAIERASDSSNDKADSLRKVLDNPDSSVEPFEDDKAMIAAMRDPRYAGPNPDVNYRALVAQRIRAGLQASGTPTQREPSTSERDLSRTSRVSMPSLNADVSVEQAQEAFVIEPFRSREEMSLAFKDSRYRKSGTWRSVVAARCAVTDLKRLA